MKEKPRKITESIINKKIVIKNITQGLAIFLAFFGSYYYLIKTGVNQTYAMTFTFSVLVLSNVFIVYVLESNDYAINNIINNLKDKVITLINLIILVMLVLIIYIPLFNNLIGTTSLKIVDLLLVILISSLATFSFDIVKIIKKNK